jgi:pimeloyl-ACP methyl ester carboxylesterase
LNPRIAYFGSQRPLLGALHVTPRLRPRSTAVLLCAPFGEEAPRAHRTLRALATALDRAGYPALRFDYSCSGDSAGDATAATVDAWVADIGEAARHLLASSGSPRVTLVGLRLGASLAALAAARGVVRPRHLVMWDPVVHGGTYLRELTAQHRTYMRDEMGGAYRDRLEVRPDGSPTEALGTPIGDALAEGVVGIDLAALRPGAELVSVIRTRPAAETEPLRASLPPQTRWIDLAGSPAWNSDAALNAMVVPLQVVRAIVGRIEEATP